MAEEKKIKDPVSQGTGSLIESSLHLEKSLRAFQDINTKSHVIALNAAIEGARMRSKLGTFSIVAEQIATQAVRNNEMCESLELLIVKIKTLALESSAIRNLELALDLIDKLDRNLFERNCDVQAWTTFLEIRESVLVAGHQSAAAADETITADFLAKATALLKRLTTTYVVYFDSFLLNDGGKVIAAANASELVGANWETESWFKKAMLGEVVVVDVHWHKHLNRPTVLYVAPVMAEGKPAGVLCNCFNWDFALEMIQSAAYPVDTSGYVVNEAGQIIASKRATSVLTDSLEWLRGCEIALEKKCGFSIENARNGESMAVGFAHTKGYNAYKGKGWSAVVQSRLGSVGSILGSKVTSDRSLLLAAPGTKALEVESEKAGFRLREVMKEIDGLVGEINKNNRAVKLLAVNASIQSGLAGTDGEGFSIIANEVANLAKKSLAFVDHVNDTTAHLREEVEKSVSVRLVDAAQDTMDKVDRNLFERFCDIQAFASFSQVKKVLAVEGNNTAESTALLESVHKIYEVYHDIFVTNASGDIICAAIEKKAVGQNVKGKDWFTEALGGRIFVSDIYHSASLGGPIMTFAAPVVGEDGTVLGTVCSRFNCNFLNDIIRLTICDSNSKAFLVNDRLEVIGSANSEDILKHRLPFLSNISGKKDLKKGFSVEDDRESKAKVSVGFSISSGYNTYKGQNWFVAVLKKLDDSDAQKELTPAERFKALIQRPAVKEAA